MYGGRIVESNSELQEGDRGEVKNVANSSR